MRRTSRRPPTASSADPHTALLALGVDELRAVIGELLETLEDHSRRVLEDALLRRASRSGWRPAARSPQLVAEVRAFAAAACRVGYAEPGAVDDYLREGVTASLAGDHATAQGILGALLEPMTQGEITMGEDETVDEVLSVDVHECATRYVAAVYATAPSAERVERVEEALGAVGGLTYWDKPLASLETALGGPLPDLAEFLPRWIAHLQGDQPGAEDLDSEAERWLREAVTRAEGTAGLARLARTSRRPESLRAWCESVVATGDWTAALGVYEEAAATAEGYWRGSFLDGAALAARVLGRKDATRKLEAAWRGAPSLLRLLRWLLDGQPSARKVRERAAAALAAALKDRPTDAPRVIGLLHLVRGDIPAAANLLAAAPGLGWSHEGHPGHVLFPALAWLLGDTPAGSVRDEVAAGIRQPCATAFETGDDGLDEADGPHPASTRPAQKLRLPVPAVFDLLLGAELSQDLAGKDRATALTAMKTAATSRVDGVLGQKRRRHYGHAALLVACCAELEQGSDKAGAASPWLEALRSRTSRYPAFQDALRLHLAKARRGAG